MSVLKAHRSESKAEFVNAANKIYIQTINFLSRLSARYSRLMSDSVSNLASSVLDPKLVMQKIIVKAESLGLIISREKSRIVPITKPFRYCKAKYTLTETGKVVVNGNRDGVKRARRKIKAFYDKIQNGEMNYEDLWTSVNGMLMYFEGYDDHARVLRLRRLFYAIFGFSPETIDNFRRMENKRCNILFTDDSRTRQSAEM